MSTVRLARDTFAPGSLLEGDIIIEANEHVTLTIGWSTSGKGDTDAAVYYQHRYDRAHEERRLPLSIRLPLLPLSYDGYLVKISWSILVEGSTKEEVPFLLAYPAADEAT